VAHLLGVGFSKGAALGNAGIPDSNRRDSHKPGQSPALQSQTVGQDAWLDTFVGGWRRESLPGIPLAIWRLAGPPANGL
jgi:hypothetical protein